MGNLLLLHIVQDRGAVGELLQPLEHAAVLGAQPQHDQAQRLADTHRTILRVSFFADSYFRSILVYRFRYWYLAAHI